MSGIWHALFGWPDAWSTGGNMVAWVICGALGGVWLRRKLIAHHAQMLAQAAQHHKEQMAQAQVHHEDMKRHIAAHCSDVKEHVSAMAGPAVPPPATRKRGERM